MSRWNACLLFLLLAVGSWYVWAIRHKAEKYSLLRDTREARAYIEAIRTAEQRCYAERQRYLSLSELSQEPCGGAAALVTEGEHNGFRIEVEASGSAFWARVGPSSIDRLISLYTDQDGEIRVGTRFEPASRESGVLR